VKQLTKVQKYAIEYLRSIKTDEDQICKELKISKDMLTKYIEKTGKSKNDNSKELPVKSSKITSKDMMIRKTSAKGLNTVAIMTQNAAFINDDFKQKNQPKVRNSDHIHRIKK
jgi:hypothetical protein